MEISSCVISKSMPCYYSGVGGDAQLGKLISSPSRVCFRGGNLFPSLKGKAKPGRNWDFCGFAEKGHLDYYKGSPVCGERKKKKMKLLKGLVKDLKEFLDCDEGLVGGDDKGKVISEAADILLAQLKQLRAEEEKSNMKKDEKKKSKDLDCESSSSSSESSDDECDEVVDMKCLRKSAIVQPIEHAEGTSASLPTLEGPPSNQECCNMILQTTLNNNATIEVLNSETLNPNQSSPASSIASLMTMAQEKRIEVCMGGKCKKSGGPALIEEFQRVMGNEATVVGCKCMGKCKSAPNVRLLHDESVGDDSLRTPSNPVLTGVGLEDVELIVANYFGEEKGLGVAVVALPS